MNQITQILNFKERKELEAFGEFSVAISRQVERVHTSSSRRGKFEEDFQEEPVLM